MSGAAAVERQSLRLALFSPVPPIPSGIAAYTADLLPLLPQSCAGRTPSSPPSRRSSRTT